MRTHYTLFAHSLCTLCALIVHAPHTLCALVVYSPCKLCAFTTHALCTLCAPTAHSVYALCAFTLHSPPMRRAFAVHSLGTHFAYTIHSVAVTAHTLCSLFTDGHAPYVPSLCTRCPFIVHSSCTQCDPGHTLCAPIARSVYTQHTHLLSMHTLRSHYCLYALTMYSLCTLRTLYVHSVCTYYVFSVHSRYTHGAHTHTHTHTHFGDKQSTQKTGPDVLDLVRCKAEQK